MVYTAESIQSIVSKQRQFFRTGKTLDIEWRIKSLKALRKMVVENEDLFLSALQKDLGRSKVEAYLCDIGPIITEINETIHGLRRWARPELHFSGIMCFPSITTRVYKMPYGVCLIISPFNFPLLLSLGVLAACISGGNAAVIKTSSKTVACTEVLKKCISEYFPE